MQSSLAWRGAVKAERVYSPLLAVWEEWCHSTPEWKRCRRTPGQTKKLISTRELWDLGRTRSLKAHLHQLLFVVEVRNQDVFPVCHSGEGDSQAPAGLMVTVSWKGAAHHVTYDLHQVKGRMHGAEEPLPRLLCDINDARTGFSCKDIF